MEQTIIEKLIMLSPVIIAITGIFVVVAHHIIKEERETKKYFGDDK